MPYFNKLDEEEIVFIRKTISKEDEIAFSEFLKLRKKKAAQNKKSIHIAKQSKVQHKATI